MFKNIKNKVFKPYLKLLTNKQIKILKYRNIEKAKDILKIIDKNIINERIKNSLIKVSNLQEEEEKRAIEIKILSEIVKEDPHYYTEEEFNIILNNLYKKKP